MSREMKCIFISSHYDKPIKLHFKLDIRTKRGESTENCSTTTTAYYTENKSVELMSHFEMTWHIVRKLKIIENATSVEQFHVLSVPEAKPLSFP